MIARNNMQWIATFTMCLLNVQSGLEIGWASPNIARFTKNTSEIHLTPEEVTWVSSANDLAGVFGALVGPLSVQFFGANTTTLISFLAFFLSWTCILLADSFLHLLIGRALCGAANIVAYVAFAIYIGEISSPEIRGTLISIATTGALPGIILSGFLETRFSPKISCPIYMVGCLTGMALLLLALPESPYFLVKTKNIVKTKKSIAAYFPEEQVEKKLTNIQNFVKSQTDHSIKDKLIDIFGSSRTRKLMFLTFVLASLTTASGLVTIQRYLQIILERANSHVVDPKDAIIYVNLAIFFLRLVTCNLADKFGRKFLFVLSGITVSFASFVLGLYFYLLHSDTSMDSFEWVPITCVLTLKTCFSIGFTTAMFTILGELCPPSAKNINNFISYVTIAFVAFVMTKIFLPVSHEFGEEYIFWIQSVCGFSVIPVVIFLLPESKGKKLEDV